MLVFALITNMPKFIKDLEKKLEKKGYPKDKAWAISTKVYQKKYKTQGKRGK